MIGWEFINMNTLFFVHFSHHRAKNIGATFNGGSCFILQFRQSKRHILYARPSSLPVAVLPECAAYNVQSLPGTRESYHSHRSEAYEQDPFDQACYAFLSGQNQLIIHFIRTGSLTEQIQQLFHSQTLLSLTIEIADGNGKNLLFG